MVMNNESIQRVGQRLDKWFRTKIVGDTDKELPRVELLKRSQEILDAAIVSDRNKDREVWSYLLAVVEEHRHSIADLH